MSLIESKPTMESPDLESATEPEGALSVAVVTLGCARNEVDSEELRRATRPRAGSALSPIPSQQTRCS